MWFEISINDAKYNVLHQYSLVSEITITTTKSPPPPHIYILMLRKDKKTQRRRDVLEVWNGLTSKPPGENLQHEMQASDWQELFKVFKAGSTFQAMPLPRLWEACVASREAEQWRHRKPTLNFGGNGASCVDWCRGEGKEGHFFKP